MANLFINMEDVNIKTVEQGTKPITQKFLNLSTVGSCRCNFKC